MFFQIMLASWQKHYPDPEKNDVVHYTFRGQFDFECESRIETDF